MRGSTVGVTATVLIVGAALGTPALPVDAAARPGSAAGARRTVVVSTDALRYRPGQAIVVTIRNRLTIPITTTTGRASCSIVSLDRWAAGSWVEVRNCSAGVPPETVTIGAGRMVRVRLRDQLRNGTYRARVEYEARGCPGRAYSRRVQVG